MSRKIHFAPRVRTDIIRIYNYIAERSPQSAERVVQAIRRSMDDLAEMPGVGRAWESTRALLQGMRVTTVRRYRNYLIFFRPEKDRVEIFRVVHGARELDSIVAQIQEDLEDERL
jgi:toxin ParE1/3/4